MVVLYVILGIMAVLAAILLLFPLRIRGEFEITVEKGSLKLSFFKWHKEISKCFKKEVEKASEEVVACAPEEKKDLQKSPEKKKTQTGKSENESLSETQSGKLQSSTMGETSVEPAKVEEKSKLQLEENPKEKAREISRDRENEKQKKKREKELAKLEAKKQKKEKQAEKEDSPEFKDKDFFTLLLQPKMVSLAWKYLIKLLNETFKLFRFKFFDSFVEGIDTGNPARNGYLSAVLGALPSIVPALACVTFIINWDGSVKLGGFGKFTASVNLLRILAWILVVAYIAARLALLYFWMRYRYRKDASRYKLAWWRKKIVDFIAAED